MFRIFKTKHNFSQNEAYTKHKIQKCNSLNARLSLFMSLYTFSG